MHNYTGSCMLCVRFYKVPCARSSTVPGGTTEGLDISMGWPGAAAKI